VFKLDETERVKKYFILLIKILGLEIINKVIAKEILKSESLLLYTR